MPVQGCINFVTRSENTLLGISRKGSQHSVKAHLQSNFRFLKIETSSWSLPLYFEFYQNSRMKLTFETGRIYLKKLDLDFGVS